MWRWENCMRWWLIWSQLPLHPLLSWCECKLYYAPLYRLIGSNQKSYLTILTRNPLTIIINLIISDVSDISILICKIYPVWTCTELKSTQIPTHFLTALIVPTQSQRSRSPGLSTLAINVTAGIVLGECRQTNQCRATKKLLRCKSRCCFYLLIKSKENNLL